MPASEQIQLVKPVQIVWTHLVRPRPERTLPGGGKAASRYEVTLLFPQDHPDLPRVKAEMGRVAKEVLGRTDNVKYPMQRGDKLADEAKAKGKDRDWSRGFDMLTARANVKKQDGSPLMPPRLKIVSNKQIVNLSDDEQRPLANKHFYSGALTIPTLNFVGYSGMGGSIACYLNEILALGIGDKIQTGIDDEERYGESISEYVGKVSAIDPTAGADIQY